ncbi:hypothetical protein OSTOST_17927 [Ostertagia ostertagi]
MSGGFASSGSSGFVSFGSAVVEKENVSAFGPMEFRSAEKNGVTSEGDVVEVLIVMVSVSVTAVTAVTAIVIAMDVKATVMGFGPGEATEEAVEEIRRDVADSEEAACEMPLMLLTISMFIICYIVLRFFD